VKLAQRRVVPIEKLCAFCPWITVVVGHHLTSPGYYDVLHPCDDGGSTEIDRSNAGTTETIQCHTGGAHVIACGQGGHPAQIHTLFPLLIGATPDNVIYVGGIYIVALAEGRQDSRAEVLRVKVRHRPFADFTNSARCAAVIYDVSLVHSFFLMTCSFDMLLVG